MSVSSAAVTIPRLEAYDMGQPWERRHRLIRGLVIAAISARLRLSKGPMYGDIAQFGALAGLLDSSRMRTVASAALSALGSNPTRQATWRFAWSWWYQWSVCRVLAFRADGLTRAWAERHVLAPESLPSGGCILVSVHNFNQRLAFARLGTLFDELGGVGLFEPLPEGDPSLAAKGFRADGAARARARSRFSHQVFGPRVFAPRTAPRRGLELLQQGGSLIVLSDTFGREPGCLLGKQWLLPRGPIWWAEQSGRPIVPFVVSPVPGRAHYWQLWCGEPIPATLMALAGALEECIRRAPTAWNGWPAWYEAAPDAT